MACLATPRCFDSNLNVNFMEQYFMHPEIEKFCQQLDNLKLAIKGNGSNQFPNMNEGFSVRLTPNDLCAYIEDFVQNIKSKNIEDLIPQFLNLVQKYTVSSNKLAVEIVPHIHNGNAAHAIPSLMISLSVIKENLAPLFGYYVGLDADINPTEINRVGRQILSRVRRIEKNLVDEEKAFASISDSVNKLNSASELADLLTKKNRYDRS